MPALIKKAKEFFLEEKRLIWWKDDTHWYKYGIEVAVDIVYRSITKPGK